MQSLEMLNYDIAIIGGGPAACGAAISLKNSGLNVVILEKYSFPRSKTCGDALPGPALKFLKQIAPDFYPIVYSHSGFQKITSSRFYLTNGKFIDKHWVLDAFNIKRSDFDNLLIEYAILNSKIEFKESFNVKDIKRSGFGFEIISENKDQINSRIIIGADGANSIAKRLLTNNTLDRRYFSVACSAYYQNLPLEENQNYIYFLKNYYPGYFWIFPIGNKIFNVGYGTLASKIKKDKLSLNYSFENIILNDKAFSPLFKNANRISELKSWNIPIGWKNDTKCGPGFMLCGDAANLVDPIFGHGIDKSIQSGYLAGNQAKLFFTNGENQGFIDEYQDILFQEIGSSLSQNFKLHSLLKNRLWLFNLIGNMLSKPSIEKLFLDKLYKNS